ncbi:SDR family NAD(P)-dependent oxidoreductase [Streptomyces sp. enrichment culture]|uniref:SDR family NAD(P)-dependent oxidoreductase n=1 Tax=Streptomyces sp. enrichment culture TaxID=1795815 RepID=UPI003F550632
MLHYVNAVITGASSGIEASSPLEEMTYGAARDVLHGNLLSAFLVMKHLVPLVPEPGASIVCVSPRLGMAGMPNQTLYCAAKDGLIALARGAAMDWASRNIRVNMVTPGLTATPIIEASFQRRGATTYLEVVSTHRDQALASVRTATELGVDWLLGGT